MSSVTVGHEVHDINSRSSSRVLSRPGGQNNMDGIFSDPSCAYGQPQQQSQHQQQQQQQNTSLPQQRQAQSNYQPRHFQQSQPEPQPQQNFGRRGYHNQSSIVFGDAHSEPQQAPNTKVQQQAHIQHKPQQQQQLQQQSEPVQTSVRVRAPPGGHSSITFG